MDDSGARRIEGVAVVRDGDFLGVAGWRCLPGACFAGKLAKTPAAAAQVPHKEGLEAPDRLCHLPRLATCLGTEKVPSARLQRQVDVDVSNRPCHGRAARTSFRQGALPCNDHARDGTDPRR